MNRVYSFSGRGRNVKETEQRPAHLGQSAVVYITIHAERKWQEVVSVVNTWDT